MNKAELIAAVAAAAEISKKDAEIAVSATLDTITCGFICQRDLSTGLSTSAN